MAMVLGRLEFLLRQPVWSLTLVACLQPPAVETQEVSAPPAPAPPLALPAPGVRERYTQLKFKIARDLLDSWC